MKRIHFSRKNTILFAGIAIVSVAAALIPKAVKAAKCRKYSSAGL